jgi:hypothetical protein
VEFVNPDGIVVPFASSDVKGLMSFFYAIIDEEAEVVQMGARCRRGGRFFGRGNCEDVHPGALHVVMANQLGMLNKGFAVDADAGHEVWNQPVFAFESQIVGQSGATRDSARGTVRRVKMDTKMTYAVETHPQWEPSLGTSNWGQESAHYVYWLELDSQDRIIGGSWVGDSHPDFVWMTTKVDFSGPLAGLKQIYRPIGRREGFRFENQIPTPPRGQNSGNVLFPRRERDESGGDED